MHPLHIFTGFDIETRPQSSEQLTALKPEFKAPSNYSKPEAIAKFIGEKEEAWFADAALSPFTGSLVVIGLVNQESTVEYLDGDDDAAPEDEDKGSELPLGDGEGATPKLTVHDGGAGSNGTPAKKRAPRARKAK